MIPRAWVNRLAFSDGTEVALDQSDIIVVVGPNNAGKSAALRAIRDKVNNSAVPSPVITSLRVSRSGSSEDVLSWLESFAKRAEGSPENPIYQTVGIGVHRSHVMNEWGRGEGEILGSISRLFCHLLTADERLQAANAPQNIAIVREPPSHPIHYLLRDDKLETRLSQQFKKAFGIDLVLHRNAGSQIPLHTGTRPVPGPGQDRLSYEYIQELEKLPPLQGQGDGMRSFAGVLLYTSLGRESILLIDEPEAFLHPPQARHLGRMLVADKPVERQLFVATHSGDVLRGILDANSKNVRVLRITRAGAVNVVRQLDNANIAELWNDPLLRYSNILDGLFHERVIVCESDSDARFYSAVADAVIEAKGADSTRPDIMFTHCGGKDRLAMVIRALREVNVPVRAVADFDVLHSDRPLRDIIVAAGGSWDEFSGDWNQVRAAIESKKPELGAPEVVKEIQDVLSKVTEQAFPDSAKQAIQKIFRRSSPWATAKEVGRAFVPSGQPTQAYERLTTKLRDLGLYVVEVGEVERFVPSVGAHGPRWVNEVLKKNLQDDSELGPARSFVGSLLP